MSDLHLGAGFFFEGKRNPLEDFHYDQELVDFLDYYSKGDYSSQEVELVINGDFLDFLAVPYVKYFDDVYWREDASLEKLKIILNAHQEVFEAIKKFLSQKNKKITYVIGNHDAELSMAVVKEHFLNHLGNPENLDLIDLEDYTYCPIKNVVIEHGHNEEMANSFTDESFIKDDDGKEYLIPPWGSYFVKRVVNRFKSERDHVNSVRPIKKFLINGLIYDTYFTTRFILATVYYYVMVRFIYYFKIRKGKFDLFTFIKNEFDLFLKTDNEKYQRLLDSEDFNIQIVGHTHHPELTQFPNGKTFINTGTWTHMYQLDFGRDKDVKMLTYAKIDSLKTDKKNQKLDVDLLVWTGPKNFPFYEFS